MRKSFFLVLLMGTIFFIIGLPGLGYCNNTLSSQLPGGDHSSNETVISFELQFSIESFSFSKKETYDFITHPSCIETRQVGAPRLPLRVIHVALDPDKQIRSVEILDDNLLPLPGHFVIYPAQKTIRLKDTPHFTPPLPSIYTSSERYPPMLIEKKAQGTMSGLRVATFHIYPLEYDPSRRKLTLHQSFTVRIVLEKKEESGPAHRQGKWNETVKSMLQKVVINPEAVEEQWNGSSEKDNIDYLIITSTTLLDSGVFQPLLDSKTAKGLNVLIESVSSINSTTAGRDIQEKIRNFIKNKFINNNLTWVLLAGDSDTIPGRYAYIGYMGSVLCDMYYSDLDGDWDADGDSIFGETTDDVDLYPDVFVGRAPVENVDEAQAFVTKVNYYEQNVAGYFNKALFLGCDDFGDAGGSMKDYIDEHYLPALYDPVTKYYERDILYYRSLTINSLNEGYHLVNHIDHADVGAICTGNDYLSIADINGLTNTLKPSIIWTCGCYPAAFDYNCIAEHWLTNPNGGGVAFIGNSRDGLHPESDQMLDPEFYHSLFIEGINHIGQTVADSKITYIGLANSSSAMRYALFELNLLGDPEMSIMYTTNSLPTLSLSGMLLLLLALTCIILLFSKRGYRPKTELRKLINEKTGTTDFTDKNR